MLRRRSAEVSAESSLRGAWASAWLSGVELPLEDVRDGAASALSDPTLQGALRAMGALGSLADTWGRAPRQALARLHALAAADLTSSPDDLGRPTREAADRLDTLAAVLAATRAPAIIVAGIVHGELLSLSAFPPAAGVVARAAARLCLIDRGLDPKSLVVLESGHRDLAGEYALALDAYRTGTPHRHRPLAGALRRRGRARGPRSAGHLRHARPLTRLAARDVVRWMIFADSGRNLLPE